MVAPGGFDITSLDALAKLYATPRQASLVKELARIDDHYRALIEASPFAVLATAGPAGLDCSPRGDRPRVVIVEDERTLLLPDRRGNNRLDSLRNIVGDPRVALLFLIPGIAETLRVNGTATISAAPDLLDRFVANGQRPATVIVIRVDAVYFQCSRAVVRADLWNAAGHVEASRLPSVGRILADASAARGNVAPIDGEAYDRDLPGRIATTLY